MPIGSGVFVAYIKKLMAGARGKKALSARDVSDKSGNLIPQASLSKILGGHTTWTLRHIDGLAKGLEVDRQVLLNLAAEDWVSHVLEHYTAERSKVLRRQCHEPKRIPLVRSNELADVLSPTGYPSRFSQTLPTPWDFGPRSFAILMKDDSMKPMVIQGQTCILAPAKSIVGEDYGLFGTETEGIFMGRLKSDKSYYQARFGDEDFDLRSTDHRNVTFVLRVEIVIRRRWESGRKSPGPK